MPYGPASPLYNPFKKVPVLGKWYGRVGRVYAIYNMPCQPTPQIWVYAAWVSTPRLLWSLFKPDFTDLKYDQVKAGFKRHGRKGKFKIHTMQGPKYPVPKGLGWAIFEGAEFAQRVGWYLCVIDATLEFAVNWSTLAYQYSGCAAPGIGYANLNIVDPELVGPNPGLGTISAWHFLTADKLSTGPTGIGVPAGYNYVINASVVTEDAHIPGYPYASTSFEIYDQANDNVISTLDETPHPDGSRGYSGVAYVPFGPQPTHTFTVRYRNGAGIAKVSAGSFSCYASKIKLNLDLKPDP